MNRGSIKVINAFLIRMMSSGTISWDHHRKISGDTGQLEIKNILGMTGRWFEEQFIQFNFHRLKSCPNKTWFNIEPI